MHCGRELTFITKDNSGSRYYRCKNCNKLWDYHEENRMKEMIVDIKQYLQDVKERKVAS